MPSRFVILHHTVQGGEHWDLLLEHGDVLLAWQLFCDPTAAQVFPIHARRIGDHRKRYLDYEGPISGDRGHVARVDLGTVKIEELAVSSVRFQLCGRRIAGTFELREADDGDMSDRWILQRSAVR